MSFGELVSIQPNELRFPFELKKQISCSLQLTNQTDLYVAFKVKTTNPKKYCVRPNTGVVLPRSTCDVVVTMQAQRETPPDMQCKDKFLIQSVITTDGAAQKDITPEMVSCFLVMVDSSGGLCVNVLLMNMCFAYTQFNKDAGNHLEECKLRVVYVSPPQPPSPVAEGSEEGSSPRASLSDIGNAAAFDSVYVLREDLDSKDKVSETRVAISRLTEEKSSVIQLNNKLQQELELLRKQSSRAGGGIPFLYVVIVGLLGILIGYLIRRT
ncbi:Vesicle-associated protein 1-2 [Nymphaea thermarum]|nr:Vesicle-associated protein 1-2 [Nymphaea thermarum]